MFETRLGHAREAIQTLHKVVELMPNAAEAHLNLGIALADHMDLDGALAQFSEAVRLQPDSAAAHYNKGRIAIRSTPQRRGQERTRNCGSPGPTERGRALSAGGCRETTGPCCALG
ncbi:MAG: hypothetical protein DMG57_34590 [Acidobacteria bacterium]|nr:MAG: hypothetical protein DMG57_34590 [Acidobacteriota bacterium]